MLLQLMPDGVWLIVPDPSPLMERLSEYVGVVPAVVALKFCPLAEAGSETVLPTGVKSSVELTGFKL